MVKLNEDIFLDPSEVVSVQREIVNEYASSSPSDNQMIKNFDGSRIILKCGRKVFVRGMIPTEIIKILGISPTKQTGVEDESKYE